MARRSTRSKKSSAANGSTPSAEVLHPVPISEEVRRRYLNYAMSVITSRALPAGWQGQ